MTFGPYKHAASSRSCCDVADMTVDSRIFLLANPSVCLWRALKFPASLAHSTVNSGKTTDPHHASIAGVSTANNHEARERAVETLTAQVPQGHQLGSDLWSHMHSTRQLSLQYCPQTAKQHHHPSALLPPIRSQVECCMSTTCLTLSPCVGRYE